MNLLFAAIGRRSYMIDYFRKHLSAKDRIIGTSSHEWSAALRYCDEKYILPPIVSDEYIPALLSLCGDLNINGLLSFFDQDIDRISYYKEQLLEAGVTPIIPSAYVSRIGFDKFETYTFLTENKIPTPPTFNSLPEAEAATKNRTLQFPVVVKPQFGFASHSLFIAKNSEQMAVFFNYEPDMLIQEFVDGVEFGLDICTSLEGKVLSIVPRKKIALRAGETDIAVSVKDDRLFDFSLHFAELMASCGHVGPMDVDVFEVDGKYLVLELNPRFGGGYPLAQLAGADFPELIIKMIKGEHVESRLGQYKSGVTMMKEYKIMEGQIEGIKNVTQEI